MENHSPPAKLNSTKMQINLSNIPIKEGFKYLGWILLFAVLWFNGCSGNEKSTVTSKVVIPKKEGKFESKKPVHIPFVPKTEPVMKGETGSVKNQMYKKMIAENVNIITENEKLKSDYAKANDSIRSLLFDKTITLNEFSSKFEDEHILININGIVQGEVKEITPSYIRKEIKSELDVKQKETMFRLLLGAGVGLNKELNQFMYKFDGGFQNRKGDVFTAEYLKVNNQEYGMVGFKKSIFEIRR